VSVETEDLSIQEQASVELPFRLHNEDNEIHDLWPVDSQAFEDDSDDDLWEGLAMDDNIFAESI